jgi:cytochrome P450
MSLVIPPEVVNFDKFTNELISERVAQELSERPATAFEKGNDDFVTLFRDEDGSLSTSSIDEIKSEATTLLVAGSDTVSTAISGLLFYLAHNPRCLEKLNVEIRSRFSTVVDIRRGYELSGAKYLRACIDETLRMSPPTPGYLGRTVLEGGITIDGQYFPAGVELGAPIYALHHNSDYYPRPNDFWPERWLQEIDGKTRAETISQDPALARAAFAAFSTGRHGCAGKEFAYLEITLFIARLVYQYNVQLADDEKRNFGEGQGPYGPWGRRIRGHFQIKDHFTGTGYGPWIQFRRR